MIIIIIIGFGQSLNCIHPTEDIDSDRFLNRCDQSRLFLSCDRRPIATELSSAENALTCECGEFDESTGASYVDNDLCYPLGAVSRTAEGFLRPAEGFA